MDNYVKYPPTGPLPLPGGSYNISQDCDLWDEIFNAALIINPAFNIYRIFDVVRPSNPNLLVFPSTFFLVSHSLGCAGLPVSFHVHYMTWSVE